MLVIDAEDFKMAREGDLRAIERICLATWEPLYRFIYYKVQNRAETEDITQETYVKTLKYLKESKVPQENFLGFMKTVSLNLIRDRWRKRRRREKFLDFTEAYPAETADTDGQNEIARRLLLESAFAKLSREQQTILDLRIIKGYSVAETSKILGKSESAIRTAQHRALKALAKILDEAGQKAE